MSISYSGIVNYGKAILPSVESWGTNNNILRDPPRAITTRRIDKVSETMMIDQEIQESGNRVAESIRVYPRGANVMVGVSFDNYGSNGGKGIGQNLLYRGQQSKLPYRVARDGAFRPPILTPVDLLPLSRLPRNNVTVNPVAYTADYTRKLVCPGTAKDYRSVKNETMQVNATAPKVQYVRTPVEVGVGQNIQDKIHTTATAAKVQYVRTPVEVGVGQNIQSKLAVQGETHRTQRVEKPMEVGVGQSIKNETLHPEAYSNIRIYDNANHNSVKYTNDSVKSQVIHYNTSANRSQNIQKTVVDSKIVYQPNLKINTSAQSSIKGTAVKYNLHETQELKNKPVLRGQISVNQSQRGVYGDKSQAPTSRDVYLPKKGSVGFKESAPLIPSFDRNWGERKLNGRGFGDMMKNKKSFK